MSLFSKLYLPHLQTSRKLNMWNFIRMILTATWVDSWELLLDGLPLNRILWDDSIAYSDHLGMLGDTPNTPTSGPIMRKPNWWTGKPSHMSMATHTRTICQGHDAEWKSYPPKPPEIVCITWQSTHWKATCSHCYIGMAPVIGFPAKWAKLHPHRSRTSACSDW